LGRNSGNPRHDPIPAPAFRKNRAEEDFLASLNRCLVPLEASLMNRAVEIVPVLFILGLPRSGTTLLSQLLASSTSLGYVSNFGAKFWDVPLVGARLAKGLAVDAEWASSFHSTFGRTHGPREPHEFGYFWSRHLGYRELAEPDERQRRSVDWPRLRSILWHLCATQHAPFFFKNVLLNWHARELHEHVTKSCFVRIKRNRIEVARSLLRMREQFMGSRERWVSAKPRRFAELRDKPYWEQIAGQVLHLEASLSAEWTNLSPERKLEFDLHDVRLRPAAVVAAILDLLRGQGAEVAARGDSLPRFSESVETLTESRDDERLIAAFERLEYAKRVDD
jgi:hypothetical protein